MALVTGLSLHNGGSGGDPCRTRRPGGLELVPDERDIFCWVSRWLDCLLFQFFRVYVVL